MRNWSVVRAALGAMLLALLTASPNVSQARQGSPPTLQRPALFVAIYERGPAWDDAKGALEQSRIQEHMAYLRANLEKLVGAAPFQQGISVGSTDPTVGMVVVAADNQEDAQRFVAGDPAIAAGLMKTTVRRWLADYVKAF